MWLAWPNAVVLMVLLYALAQVLMTRMILGQYVYTVDGNAGAARLSVAPVRHILVFVYAVGDILTGLA